MGRRGRGRRWRLAAEHWGRGYAPEAAQAALRFAFGPLDLPEVMSMTSVRNQRSRRVMDKLGLTHRPERDFDHPRTPGWSGRRHVVHAIDAAAHRTAHRAEGTVGR